MKHRTPPKLAMFLLDRFGPAYQRESLTGDLIEQFHKSGSTAWVWREVLCAVLLERLRIVESWHVTAKTLVRMINAIMLAAAIALGAGTLTRADSRQTSCVLQVRC